MRLFKQRFNGWAFREAETLHPRGTVPPHKMHPGSVLPKYKMHPVETLDIYDYFFLDSVSLGNTHITAALWPFFVGQSLALTFL